MNKREVRHLSAGVYFITWRSGGPGSIAAIGVTSDGGRWLAPINWVLPTEDQKWWRDIVYVTPMDCFIDSGSKR